jgi:energy-coupling factor transport system substrate-specific component
MEILCIEETADGRLLLGSDGDGIYVLDDGMVSRLGRDDGLLSEVILRLKKDPIDEALFWVITSNSIGYLRDGKITSIKNFPYSNNFDLYFDSLGRVWILSSNGIYVTLRTVLMTDDEKMDYVFYDTECGLPHITTANSYSQLDEDGTLFIACSTGVTSVNINNNSENNSEVRLAVPFITVDDRYIGIHGETEIHIPADCRRLNIFPYAFTYSMNNPRISYYLEGFDKEPQEVDKRDLTGVSYTNLDGNTYRFHLSVINTLTGREDQTLVVTLIKDKALHEQIWFWIVLAVLVLALLAGTLLIIFRRKTAVLLRKQEEHTKMIDEMTRVFANCIDMKDAYTNGHSVRVAKYTAMLARKLGKNEEEIHQIYNIALLHDIGKISIPDSILNKPGRLTDEEFVVMKNHSARGNEILKDITIAPDLALGAGYHHERIDGRGYPAGLKGDEIPEVAQIIAVADTFDAMYSTRPYRKKMELSTVVDEIRRSAGTQLSEKVVNAFVQLVEEGAFKDE